MKANEFVNQIKNLLEGNFQDYDYIIYNNTRFNSPISIFEDDDIDSDDLYFYFNLKNISPPKSSDQINQDCLFVISNNIT